MYSDNDKNCDNNDDKTILVHASSVAFSQSSLPELTQCPPECRVELALYGVLLLLNQKHFVFKTTNLYLPLKISFFFQEKNPGMTKLKWFENP